MDGHQYAEARAAHARGDVTSAELASIYVAARVRAQSGARWKQGARRPAWPSDALPQAVRLFAEERLRCVEEAVARALVQWARGARDVVLLFDVPTPREVLALQARGRRCVSLLDDDARAAPHADGLAFALHDLCHLEKFVEPEHHVPQVGFFATVDGAIDGAPFRAMEARFDEAWRDDFAHVVADMNGSPIFLFAALKMKLKMASRRALARERGVPPRAGGTLDEGEARAFAASLEELLDALDLRGEARDAASCVTTKRDHHAAALVLQAYFARAGEAALASRAREA